MRSAMSSTTTRNRATAWAPYIALIVTIVLAVGGAAWSISSDLAQLRTKVNANARAIRDVRHAVRDARDAIEANGRAIAASNTEQVSRWRPRSPDERGCLGPDCVIP